MTHKKEVALITGGRSGIGYELTKKLLNDGWRVISLDRTPYSQEESIIKKAFENGILKSYPTDLSDFSKLKETLNEVKNSEEYIDVIFNNAGSMAGSLKFSSQGREIDFEVNTVVPFIIANELKDLLLKGNLKTIINTSSNAVTGVKNFDVDKLEQPTTFKKLFGSYASSKLALSLWTKELSQYFGNQGIEIRSADPGASKTPLSKSDGMPKILLYLGFLFSHPSKGANRLFEVAIGKFRGHKGVFIMKEKNIALKFQDQSKALVEKLNFIYKNEYLKNQSYNKN